MPRLGAQREVSEVTSYLIPVDLFGRLIVSNYFRSSSLHPGKHPLSTPFPPSPASSSITKSRPSVRYLANPSALG